MRELHIQQQLIVKLHRDSFTHMISQACSPEKNFHQFHTKDSIAVINPFMPVAN